MNKMMELISILMELPNGVISFINRFKGILVFAAVVSLMSGVFSCKTTPMDDCIDASKISEGACTFEYNPVCGCDGKTYSNTCMAERSGVTSWTSGECEEE